MKKLLLLTVFAVLIGFLAFGCGNSIEPTRSNDNNIDADIAALMAAKGYDAYSPPPSPLVSVNFLGEELSFWPYNGTSFSGTPQDPVNLIFFGETDPRDIRAALLSLDGDRTDDSPGWAYPPIPPFNLTWDITVGDVHTGYGEPDGWTGGCIQLACGDYSAPRFHIRLFKIGQWTVANVHFEVLIPGTTDHQVLSWEAAERFVLYDFLRSGLLDQGLPVGSSEQINSSPFGEIPWYIYNELPAEVRLFIEGPIEDIPEYSYTPIGTDGYAVILNLAGTVPRQPEVRTLDFVINYDQVVPKPFCSSGPDDFIYVQGPVLMTQTVELGTTGDYEMNFQARGTLTVTPFDPINKVPIGEPITALVRERHASIFTDDHFSASSMQYQKLLPPSSEEGGKLFTRLHVKSNGRNGYNQSVWCGPDQLESE